MGALTGITAATCNCIRVAGERMFAFNREARRVGGDVPSVSVLEGRLRFACFCLMFIVRVVNALRGPGSRSASERELYCGSATADSSVAGVSYVACLVLLVLRSLAVITAGDACCRCADVCFRTGSEEELDCVIPLTKRGHLRVLRSSSILCTSLLCCAIARRLPLLSLPDNATGLTNGS